MTFADLPEKYRIRLSRMYARATNRTGDIDREADNAQAALSALCTKLGVTPQQVMMAAAGKDKAGLVVEFVPVASNAVWRAQLGWALQAFTHTYVVRHVMSRGGQPGLWVSGTPADIESFRAFYRRLEAEIDQDTVAYLSTLPRWYDAGQRRSCADSYRKGEAQGIRDRFVALAREADAHNPGATDARPTRAGAWTPDQRGHVALVGREQGAKETMKTKLTISVYRPSEARNATAYLAGHRDGLGKGAHRGNLG